MLHQAARNLTLPLSDASIIREQAAEKDLDPALIAAVIYAETKFDPRPSSAGAEGLMQILPSTAYYLAHLSGGSSFTASDLASRTSTSPTAATTCATCSTTTTATRCSRWPPTTAVWPTSMTGSPSRAEGTQLSVDAIPFPETREYVQRVLGAQARTARPTRGSWASSSAT